MKQRFIVLWNVQKILVSNHERRIRINQRDGSYTENKVQTMPHLYAKRNNIFFLFKMFKEKNCYFLKLSRAATNCRTTICNLTHIFFINQLPVNRNQLRPEYQRLQHKL